MKVPVTIDPHGGTVTIEIQFGYASIGRFWAWIYDKNGKNPLLCEEGASDNDNADVIKLPDTPSNLIGRLVFIRAKAALATNEDGNVSTKLSIKQAGEELNNAELRCNLNPGQDATFSFGVRLNR